MGKQSRNVGNRGWFSRGELKHMDWFTARKRINAYSVKQWDHCTLCLNVVEDAVVCPSGDLFCKSCVYEYIVCQKKAQRKQLKAYEDQKILKVARRRCWYGSRD